jgi:ribose 5-phosphate isomerase RpiB
MSRQHNGAKALCFGTLAVGVSRAVDIEDASLGATLEGERHATRVAKISIA